MFGVSNTFVCSLNEGGMKLLGHSSVPALKIVSV